MWRKFLKIFGKRVVMTVDFDGEVRYCFAKETPLGLVASKIDGKILLNSDGTVSDSYVKKWVEI
jgi:hypothetical protein